MVSESAGYSFYSEINKMNEALQVEQDKKLAKTAIQKSKTRRKKKKDLVFSKRVKIVVLGDERVGKTSITKRYCLGGLTEDKKMDEYLFSWKE